MLPRTLQAIRRAPVAFNLSVRAQPTWAALHTFTRTGTRTPPVQPVIHLKAVSELTPCCRPSALLLHARGVASSVSHRPGSQTPSHAAQNIKEEVSNTAGSVARGIAGANVTVDSVRPVDGSFLGITSAVASSVPKPALVLGLAGGLPYLGTSATVVYLAREAGLAAAGFSTGVDPGVAITILDQALSLQVTYGAVMLSFLGALHWGMEFAGFDGQKGYSRLLLGAAPVMFGWSTLALDPTFALIAQWIGFTALWWADLKATNAGWTPKWYSQYRFYLSILVGLCIIGSLAGTSYFGPVAGHGFETQSLKELRSERKKYSVENSGKVGGNMEAVETDSRGDTYVMLKKKPEGGEGKGEREKKNDSGEDREQKAE
ncbi:hypothetical protein EW145_g4196 [Phellinidium pouzarii]|uniref:Mnn4-regulates the mannosylphosphorylation n=1 Tax=Phellinidium pouzarii TaxID=167371 RepID=A0A4S4L9G4_9AGAM|nr:hypothetical protein EW145_g4196 [Phellinidium pouzarii]